MQVRVHDAFLVRYAAGAQAQLPMHTDESQFSFTLALNPSADYGGGGTCAAMQSGTARQPRARHAYAHARLRTRRAQTTHASYTRHAHTAHLARTHDAPSTHPRRT